MKIAIIPARGNSQRIKLKNIKMFINKPIIEITFDILKKSKIFDKIILTSDDERIISKCSTFGFDNIIKRPKKLGVDNVGTEEVINHAIKILEKKIKFKSVCCIYPCSPLLEKKTILNAYSKLKTKKDFIFTVTSFPSPPEKAFKLYKNKLIWAYPEMVKLINAKHFQPTYYDVGQLYLGTKNSWKIKKKIFKGVMLSKFNTVDINDNEDWDFAELLYKNKK